MKKIFLVLLILLFSTSSFAEQVRLNWKQTHIKRTSDDMIPSTATTNSVDCSGSDYILVEASSHCQIFVRPLYYSENLGRYIVLTPASIGVVNLQNVPVTAIGTNSCVRVSASQALMKFDTFGYKNVFIQIFGVRHRSTTVGKNASDIWVAPIDIKQETWMP